MSALDLAALKALHEATMRTRTDESWHRCQDLNHYDPFVVENNTRFRVAKVEFVYDAAFIVAAHTHWLELLAMALRNEGLEAENGEIRAKLADANAEKERTEAVRNLFKAQRDSSAAEVNTLCETVVSLRAEKAAMTERLAIATKALNDIRECLGEGHTKTAWQLVSRAHEAERGKE